MNIQIRIGGIRFRFDSDDEIAVEESLSPFFCTNEPVDEVSVKVTRSNPKPPRLKGPISGEDLLLEYYHEPDGLMCLAKGGVDGYLSSTLCDSNFTEITCQLHRIPEGPLTSLGMLLRLIPIRTILQHKGVLFFHASQIAVEGKGILFTAPSGTGKTTQAKLWREYRDAKIICNDRTLIRNGLTYGYPIDGSEPVINGERYPLGAIVRLEQGNENRIDRLGPREVLQSLMPQLVIDAWDPQARLLATEQLLELVGKVPVYKFSCTLDQAAVEALEARLKMDGVL